MTAGPMKSSTCGKPTMASHCLSTAFHERFACRSRTCTSCRSPAAPVSGRPIGRSQDRGRALPGHRSRTAGSSDPRRGATALFHQRRLDRAGVAMIVDSSSARATFSNRALHHERRATCGTVLNTAASTRLFLTAKQTRTGRRLRAQLPPSSCRYRRGRQEGRPCVR